MSSKAIFMKDTYTSAYEILLNIYMPIIGNACYFNILKKMPLNLSHLEKM